MFSEMQLMPDQKTYPYSRYRPNVHHTNGTCICAVILPNIHTNASNAELTSPESGPEPGTYAATI